MKTNPDKQFKPTKQNVSKLLAAYGLQFSSYKLADSGIENCTILAQTAQGNYVLRVYQRGARSDADVQRELNFVTYLRAHSLPVAPPIANSAGDYLTHLVQNDHSWQAILMPHMPGEHATHYSDAFLTQIAVTQARMHNLAAKYKERTAFEDKLTELREGHFIKLIQNRETLDPQQQAFIARAESYVVPLDPALPRGLCHLDFDNGNILSRDDSITAILDFNDLALAPYIMCPAYSLWHIIMDRGLDVIKPYIQAYEQQRALIQHEKDNLIPMILFRHYVVGCLKLATGTMDDRALTQYLELEDKLLRF
jgi:Ser/Thr protein kinase RdoA (MazF antagonist)